MIKIKANILALGIYGLSLGLSAETKQQKYSLSEVDAAFNLATPPINIGLPGGGGFGGGNNDVEMTEDCHALAGYENINANVCISTTVNSDSQDLLYFFHGAFGDEHEWTGGLNQDLRQLIRTHWEEIGFDAPKVITVSFGKTWMLNDLDKSIDNFANSIIPQIEESLVPNGLQGKRFLLGISMGGYNASQLYLKHPELWNRVAMIAPMMPLCNPYHSDTEIFKCVKNDPTKKNLLLTQMSHYLVKKFFLTEDAWLSHNPVVIGQTLLEASLPPLLVSTGDHDDFGFFTRNKEFANMAIERGTPITWLPTDGKHGRYDAIALSEFFAK